MPLLNGRQTLLNKAKRESMIRNVDYYSLLLDYFQQIRSAFCHDWIEVLLSHISM